MDQKFESNGPSFPVDNPRTKKAEHNVLKTLIQKSFCQDPELNSFSEAVNNLINGVDRQKKNILLCLSPFKKNGILDVGGRTKEAPCPSRQSTLQY